MREVTVGSHAGSVGGSDSSKGLTKQFGSKAAAAAQVLSDMRPKTLICPTFLE